jgi:hypothetical protein
MAGETRFGSARWARLAVALVNTASSRRHEDRLTRPEDLAALLLAHDEPGPVEVSAGALDDARAARSALAGVFAACDDQELLAGRLNELLARTARPRLAAHDGAPLHLHIDAPGASWGQWLAAAGAMALALLVSEHGPGVLGRCEAPDCAHVVLRIGPGPARRYCDTTCASRTRVAAHRAARKAAGRP